MMQSLVRGSSRLPQRFTSSVTPSIQAATVRHTHSSYGDKQSGHPESSEKNPMSHLEHPGPDAPATESSGSKSTEKGGTQTTNSQDKGRPAIHSPESAAEKDDPEVRKHNEEMRQRTERSVNQLSEEDNKVDKKFWTGDVGDQKKRSE